MDLVMPGGVDGVEATRKIKNISPRTQVVVLTSYHEDEHIFPAIRAGALSYILKDIGASELAKWSAKQLRERLCLISAWQLVLSKKSEEVRA